MELQWFDVVKLWLAFVGVLASLAGLVAFVWTLRRLFRKRRMARTRRLFRISIHGDDISQALISGSLQASMRRETEFDGTFDMAQLGSICDYIRLGDTIQIGGDPLMVSATIQEVRMNLVDNRLQIQAKTTDAMREYTTVMRKVRD